MKILYIFPHPDDESFGPASAVSKQRRQKHEVCLLTLTRGGATKQRHRYGYSVEEMGEIRVREMQRMAEVLDLSELTVLDLPDSGLKEMDPRMLEDIIDLELRRLSPDIVFTYPVHGISGFHDHLVCHAVVKRVFVDSRENIPKLHRLAFFTITREQAEQTTHFHLSGSDTKEIDVIFPVDEEDIARNNRCLDCYETFQETIEQSGVRETLRRETYFEVFREDFHPPLTDLTEGLHE